jgi:hypothetical protein
MRAVVLNLNGNAVVGVGDVRRLDRCLNHAVQDGS